MQSQENFDRISQKSDTIYESIYDEPNDPYYKLNLPHVHQYVDLHLNNDTIINVEVKSSEGKFCFRYFSWISGSILLILIVLVAITGIILASKSKIIKIYLKTIFV